MGVLSGVRVAVTRAAAQADELAAPLRRAGADVDLTPLIRVVPANDFAPIRDVIGRLAEFDWIIFSSVNGVELFADAMRRAGADAGIPRASIACVGPATAEAARKHGFEASVIPDEFVGHAIADALAARAELNGTRVLLARAGGARLELPDRLRSAGAIVTDVELYRSVLDADGARELRDAVAAEALDLVTFTSASTVRHFIEAVGTPGRARVAAIGPITADALRRGGMAVDIEADPHTVDGLVAAIVRYFEEKVR